MSFAHFQTNDMPLGLLTSASFCYLELLMNIDVTFVWSTVAKRESLAVAYQLHYIIVYHVTFSNVPCTNGRSCFLTNSTSSIKLEGSQTTIKLVFVLVIICCQYISIFEFDLMLLVQTKALQQTLKK